MSTRNTITTNSLLVLSFAASMLPQTVRAEFSAPGKGLASVLSGSVVNGALFWQTTTNWINGAAPAKPYSLTNDFALPACDAIPAARLVLTVWGGTTNYTSRMTVAVNGTNLPAANPLVFGSGSDSNAVFTATAANAYGAGSGLWLVTMPIPSEMLHKNGGANSITVTQTTPDSFDGRVHHVTLVAVYQSSALTNTFDYALAEGSGDIYRAPSAIQTSVRDFTLNINSSNATAATLTALYTYGDTGQNDRLYFNGVQFGGDDAATWDKTGTGLDYGPGIASFDVLQYLQAVNAVKFTVATADGVPDTRESSLRPQLAALAVTRMAEINTPLLSLADDGVLAWPANAAGFALETTTNLMSGPWTAATNTPAVAGDQYSITVDLSDSQRFYRLKKSN